MFSLRSIARLETRLTDLYPWLAERTEGVAMTDAAQVQALQGVVE